MTDQQDLTQHSSGNENGEEYDWEVVAAQNEAVIENFLRDRDVSLVVERLPEGHRSGYVAVVGKPNVGKSTLMNALLGEKLAIVSEKPQTTRANQLGILTEPDYQIVFVDTPGIHEARTKLGEYMVDVARTSIPDSDIVLFLVDSSQTPDAADVAIATLIQETRPEAVILALNKCDLVDDDMAGPITTAYQGLLPGAVALEISALHGWNIDRLLALIVAKLPPGPRYFPADVLTQTQIRDNVAEVIREQALLLYEQEVPHSLAVKVNEFKERNENLTYIAATLFVEKDSQKAILIGKNGSALKKLGKMARGELESVIGTKVYLELWVKVMKNWRRDADALKRLGFDSSS